VNSSIISFELRPKIFAALVIGLAAAVFALTAVANIVIDPQGVFATGVFPNLPNPNMRYLRFLAYQQAVSEVDGLLFASSRGSAFDQDLLAARMGVRRVANFSVPFGLLSDHLPFLEYVLRDKARRGERIKAVLVVIDVDHFGKAPWTNVNIDSFLPPSVSGEGAAYFWWRYLTAFQYRNWRISIARRLDQRAALEASRNEPGTQAGAAGPRAPPRPDFQRQIALLRQFASLCRVNGIALRVATSPLSLPNAQGLDGDELSSVVERIGSVVPVWDFSAPSPLAAQPDLWLDASHYSQAVGALMIDRMYLADTRADFGRLTGTR
jgi:hypothetical protein